MESFTLQQKIYTLRNIQVMLDSELAELYGVETRALNQAVKRNIDRFPSDFMFRLTQDEWNNLMSQFVTSNRGGVRKLPYAFTEQGLAMLSGVLNSPTAIQINIAIMRTFVAIRQTLAPYGTHTTLKNIENRVKALEQAGEETLAAINDLSEDTRREFDEIYIALSEISEKQKQLTKPRQPIGYIKNSK
jgi:hypothetical protein